MPILSRAGANVAQQYLMPQPLMTLFEKALPMGTVMEKHKFRTEYLPLYEKDIVKVGDVDLSIRPAWTDYHFNPSTHLIIVGHILFCHINPEQSWYYQPSTRLFSEDPKARLKQFKNLISRATRHQGVVFPLVAKLHS